VTNVHVVCRNPKDDRVIPRMVRILADVHGWTVGAAPRRDAALNYFCGYFEWDLHRSFKATPLAAYLTHREENAADKARLWDVVAEIMDVRVVTAWKYGAMIEEFGPTTLAPLPLERERFVPVAFPRHPVVGTSGFTYHTNRKGSGLMGKLAKALGADATFQASGRGWPVPTKRYTWSEMPRFYQGLTVWVCTSLVEGGPMGTLEALACGLPVVIPNDVGLHDELPAVRGIYRYPKGDAKGLISCTRLALEEYPTLDREALRAVTARYGPAQWAAAHKEAFEGVTRDTGVQEVAEGDTLPPWEGRCGIYYVAFGVPARKAATLSIRGAKRNMPNVPVAVVSDAPLGAGEDVFIEAPDRDIGGRIAKLKVFELAPAGWTYILYLDADTEVIGDATLFFKLLADGWEFVITKDPHRHDLLKHMHRTGQDEEHIVTVGKAATEETLALNGGVWAFRRCARTKTFFKRWFTEWDKYGQRDQPGLIRALYAHPLRMVVLGNEWNLFPKYKDKERAAAILHFPMRARRWRGRIGRGVRLDSKEAWRQANEWVKGQSRRAK